jgi:hypothetical protein
MQDLVPDVALGMLVYESRDGEVKKLLVDYSALPAW